MPKVTIIKQSRWVIVVLLLILLFCVGAILMHIRSVHKAQHKSGTITVIKPSTTSSTTTPSSSQDTSQKDPNAVRATISTTTLATPSGTFVSNHSPGQNGSPTIEESQCITTPGANCYIEFVQDGITKKLDVKTVPSSGSVTWFWDIKGSTIGPGSWQIRAVAALNGQTKTTVDPNGNLKVNQ
jgi:hypothetical protein